MSENSFKLNKVEQLMLENIQLKIQLLHMQLENQIARMQIKRNLPEDYVLNLATMQFERRKKDGPR